MNQIMKLINKLDKRLDHHRTWLFVGVVLVLAVGIAIGWQRSELKQIVSSFLGTSEQAVMRLDPSSGTYNVGDNFQVRVLLDTKGNNIVSAAAYLLYDPSLIEVEDIDTSQSDFNLNSSCEYEGEPCEIVNHYPDEGKIEIVVSRPTPGVNGDSILVATLTLKGKQEYQSEEDNFTFDFSGPYEGMSRAILDDGQGTDVLSGVENANYQFVVEDEGGEGGEGGGDEGGFNPDMDGDGDVDKDDFKIYLQYYQNGDPQADTNQDGTVNYDDLIQYYTTY